MKHYWWKSIASFLLVLFTMPLGHALMMMMDKTMTPEAVHYSAFIMGLVGLFIVVTGVFVKGDTRQTFCGLFGGLLFWTGWVEFLFQYYAVRWGTHQATRLPRQQPSCWESMPSLLQVPTCSSTVVSSLLSAWVNIN